MTFCCYRLLDASSDRSALALGDRSSSLLSDLPADEPCLLYVHMTVLLLRSLFPVTLLIE
eukprot:COSAG01_NODE_1157_length_11476_cov_87.701503_4_plen_60_part_00